MELIAALGLLAGAARAVDVVGVSDLGGRGVVLQFPDQSPEIERAEVARFDDARPIGDFDGDGYDDLAIVYTHSPPVLDAPKDVVAIIFGRPALTGRQTIGESLERVLYFMGTDPDVEPPAYLAESVSGVGDLNGDGRSDVVLGFPYLWVS